MNADHHTPSVFWVIAGTALAVASVVALVAADFRPPASVVGWAVAGPVAVSFLAVYAVQDARVRLEPGYAASPTRSWFYRLGVIVTGLAIVIDALSIGMWLGRL